MEREQDIAYHILAKGFEGMWSDDLALDTIESESERVSIRRDIVLDGTRRHFSSLCFSSSLYLLSLLSSVYAVWTRFGASLALETRKDFCFDDPWNLHLLTEYIFVVNGPGPTQDHLAQSLALS
jgi:hypothetical protein